VNRRASFRPHFVQHDRNACLRKLPGRLRACETAADDVNGFDLTRCHAVMHRLKAGKPQCSAGRKKRNARGNPRAFSDETSGVVG